MFHNEAKYPDSFTFNPERFSDEKKNAELEINELPKIAFGFGRRYVTYEYAGHRMFTPCFPQCLSRPLARARHHMDHDRVGPGHLQRLQAQGCEWRRHRAARRVHRRFYQVCVQLARQYLFLNLCSGSVDQSRLNVPSPLAQGRLWPL